MATQNVWSQTMDHNLPQWYSLPSWKTTTSLTLKPQSTTLLHMGPWRDLTGLSRNAYKLLFCKAQHGKRWWQPFYKHTIQPHMQWLPFRYLTSCMAARWQQNSLFFYPLQAQPGMLKFPLASHGFRNIVTWNWEPTKWKSANILICLRNIENSQILTDGKL